MSDSVQPHRWQPIRLPHPWDSLGKNIGMGCHFLLQCMKVKSESEVAQSCPTLSNPMDCSLPGSSIHGILQARVLEWGAIAFSRSSMQISANDWVSFHCVYPVFLPWKSHEQGCLVGRYSPWGQGQRTWWVNSNKNNDIFCHFSVDGHLGWFHVLFIVKGAAVWWRACTFRNYGLLWVYRI